MDIVLVRHAQPDWEPGGLAQDDPELTELGQRQALRVAEALEGEHFDAIYSSPLRRVRETARPIAKALAIEPRVEPWLRELELPKLSGKTRDEVQRFFQEARRRDLADQHTGFPGGETFGHFRERVDAGLRHLLAREHFLEFRDEEGHRLWKVPEKAERVLIVAHEGTNSLILCHLLDIDPVPWSWMKFSSAWAGVTRLHLTAIADAAVWSVECFNEVRHLAGLEAAGLGRAPRL